MPRSSPSPEDPSGPGRNRFPEPHGYICSLPKRWLLHSNPRTVSPPRQNLMSSTSLANSGSRWQRSSSRNFCRTLSLIVTGPGFRRIVGRALVFDRADRWTPALASLDSIDVFLLECLSVFIVYPRRSCINFEYTFLPPLDKNELLPVRFFARIGLFLL